MITIRKSNYSLSDLRDLRDMLSNGYDDFLERKCSDNLNCEICCKYYLCAHIQSTISHLQKEIEKRTPGKK